MEDLELLAGPTLIKKARARLLQMHYESKVGHIGGNLSALDAMLHLHRDVLDEDDVFVRRNQTFAPLQLHRHRAEPVPNE